jgi:hypothetical protein
MGAYAAWMGHPAAISPAPLRGMSFPCQKYERITFSEKVVKAVLV